MFVAQPRLHPLTATSVQLKMFYDETCLAVGTGFFWRIPGGMALVTAWHNFSGLHHTTRRPNSSNGGMPNRVKIRHFCKNPSRFMEQDVPLYLDDENQEPRWFVHGECGNYFDLAFMIFQDQPGFEFACVNDCASLFEGYLHPASNLVAIGFPQGVSSVGILPIWKNATLASELDLPTEGHPKFLIDIAGRGGLSGAPVYQLQRGTIIDESYPNDINSISLGEKIEFLGVYTGRVGNKSPNQAVKESSDLGFVWRSEIVVELLNNGVPDELPEPGKGKVEVSSMWDPDQTNA